MNIKHIITVLLWGLALTAAPVAIFAQRAAQETAMKLTSPAFQQDETIPDQHTCKGANVSPGLAWSEPPKGTKSFALLVDDPDAPRGTYTHWVAYNIVGEQNNLPPEMPAQSRLDTLRQGRNDFGKTGYGGPCPPHGDKPHRYSFRLYALDTTLDLDENAGKADLEAAMQGHILDQAELTGRFARQ